MNGIDPNFVAWLAGLMTLLAVTDAILRVMDRFRRRPPIEVEFATKLELKALAQQIDGSVHDLRGDLRKLSADSVTRQTHADSIAHIEKHITSLTAKFEHFADESSRIHMDIQRAIGRIEGK